VPASEVIELAVLVVIAPAKELLPETLRSAPPLEMPEPF